MVFALNLGSSGSRYIAEWGGDEKKILFDELSPSTSQVFSKNSLISRLVRAKQRALLRNMDGNVTNSR